MNIIQEPYTEYTLEMGQLRVSASPAMLTCYGLGSCVGVFLFDRTNRIGGGAHITLPFFDERDTVESKLHYADYAMETMLLRMQGIGASTNSLRAKIVGGANISGFSTLCVGMKNTESVRNILIKKGIFLAGTDVGGKSGRKVRFDTFTGQVHISTEFTNYAI
jgi:chemotaxis protein CheD